MSFGGGVPPWQNQQRNSLNAGHQQQQQQQHNSSQLGGFQSRNFGHGITGQQAPISLLSLGTNQQIFSSQTVSYPQPRALNPIAFSTNSIQRSSQNLQLQQNHNNNQSNFGNQGKGNNFQISGNSNNSGGGGGNNNRNFLNLRDQQRSSSYNAVPPPLISNEKLAGYSVNNNRSNRHITPERNRTPVRSRRNPRFEEVNDEDRKRKRHAREMERERLPRDKKDDLIEKRDRSVSRRSSPKRRKTRGVPRYMVQIPKVSLTLSESDVLELRRRYVNMYVPSDFFYTEMSWVKNFPPTQPFSIAKPFTFHIMNKEVEPIKENDAVLEPPDADYLFSAKVMLFGCSTDIYSKCFAKAEDRDAGDRDFVHPTRLMNFLVGVRGKNETMAIGGPWSKELDGENPESDNSVLIRTAIRSCKALTGIDLSNCTQWYRFVELYYTRPESCHKGRMIPSRIETVVIFLPDVRSCIPTRLEWDQLHLDYKNNLENVLKRPAVNAASGEAATAAAADGVLVEPVNSVGAETAETIETTGAADEGNNTAIEKSEATEVGAEVKTEPTLFSELDPKSMKMNELRIELSARKLSIKGVKQQLAGRLSKAIKVEADASNKEQQEQEKEKEAAAAAAPEEDLQTDELMETENDLMDMVVIDEYDSTKPKSENDKSSKNYKSKHSRKTSKKGDGSGEDNESGDDEKVLDEKNRDVLENKYTLPDSPALIVHPSRIAKSGKFDCITMSLSLLLDYRREDTKEHSFEVSLFAELFNEMLARDFGYNIFKALADLPDKPKEEVKKDEPKKEEKEKKSETVEVEVKVEDEEMVEEKAEEGSVKPEEPAKENADSEDKKKAAKSKTEDSEEDKSSIKSVDKKGGSKKEKEKEKERPKLYFTANLDLLLSFVYFDQTHCGYIFEKDIEDLFYTLGLNLSRAQTRKLVGKVITRDSLYYRKLTDKPKDSETPEETIVADVKSEVVTDEADFLKGNKSFLPIFKPVKIDQTIFDGKLTVPETSTGLIMFNGGLIDLTKLMEQMNKSDRAREDTEKLLVDLRKQNSDLEASNHKANSKIKDLSSDLKSSNRKLTDTESSLNSLQKKSNEYYSVLSNVQDKISSVLKSSSKSEKGEKNEKNEKSEKEKEKEKDDGRKDRDK